MDISEWNYFYARKLRNDSEYQLLTNVYNYCLNNKDSMSELLRRLKLLNIQDSSERQLQGGNFVSELVAFIKFIDEGGSPQWVPESQQKGVKTPDFYTIVTGSKFPVEVKTLNLPMNEGRLLRLATNSPVNEVQVNSPELSFDTKIKKDCSDAINKFRYFLALSDNDLNINGLIWFSYIPSLTTRLEKGATHQMVRHIKELADSITPKGVAVIVENAWPL